MQMNLDTKINSVISDRTTVTSVIKLFNAYSYTFNNIYYVAFLYLYLLSRRFFIKFLSIAHTGREKEKKKNN